MMTLTILLANNINWVPIFFKFILPFIILPLACVIRMADNKPSIGPGATLYAISDFLQELAIKNESEEVRVERIRREKKENRRLQFNALLLLFTILYILAVFMSMCKSAYH